MTRRQAAKRGRDAKLIAWDFLQIESKWERKHNRLSLT
jgi:hypothetical protein